MGDFVDIDLIDKGVTRALVKLSTRSKSTALDWVEASAKMIEDRAVKNINEGSRTGKLYKRRSVTHQASAVNEFPKTDTGELVKNITTERAGDVVTVGSRESAPHGYWLEFGTTKMEPRPWLKPSADQESVAINAFLNQALGDFINGI